MGIFGFLVAAIFSFMPVFIFGFVILLIKKAFERNRQNKDFRENTKKDRDIIREERKSNFDNLKNDVLKRVNSRNLSNSKSFKLGLEDISNLIKKNKEKFEDERFLSKENKEKVSNAINKVKSGEYSKEKAFNTFKELRDKGYSKDEAFKILKDIKENSRSSKKRLENIGNSNKSTEKIKESLVKFNDLKDKGKILDSELVKGCESDFISYDDNSIDNDLLTFNEQDYIKFQIYKEIFDKPLSLR